MRVHLGVTLLGTPQTGPTAQVWGLASAVFSGPSNPRRDRHVLRTALLVRLLRACAFPGAGPGRCPSSLKRYATLCGVFVDETYVG